MRWCALKAVLQERRDIRERDDGVSAVQWALNTADRETYASTPYYVMFGRAPLTGFSTLVSSPGEDWKLDALDEETLPRKVVDVVACGCMGMGLRVVTQKRRR